MEAILGIVVLIGLYLLWQFLVDMWNEWSGAYGRWRRGEPLRLGELLAVNRKTECERLERRKVELRQQHDRNPHLILDAAFCREFESRGIAADIYREVIASSGHHCAACSR